MNFETSIHACNVPNIFHGEKWFPKINKERNLFIHHFSVLFIFIIRLFICPLTHLILIELLLCAKHCILYI